MSATLYKTDGTQQAIAPANGHTFTLEELQRMAGGYVAIHSLQDGRLIVLNEDANALGLPTNQEATVMAFHLASGPAGILGDALVCDAAMIE